MEKDVLKEMIGKWIEIRIESLPESISAPEAKTRLLLQILKTGISTFISASSGVIGGTKMITVQSGGKNYEIKCQILLLKNIAPQDIVNDSIYWVEAQQKSNKLNSVVADEAINFLKSLIELDQL